MPLLPPPPPPMYSLHHRAVLREASVLSHGISLHVPFPCEDAPLWELVWDIDLPTLLSVLISKNSLFWSFIAFPFRPCISYSLGVMHRYPLMLSHTPFCTWSHWLYDLHSSNYQGSWQRRQTLAVALWYLDWNQKWLVLCDKDAGDISWRWSWEHFRGWKAFEYLKEMALRKREENVPRQGSDRVCRTK